MYAANLSNEKDRIVAVIVGKVKNKRVNTLRHPAGNDALQASTITCEEKNKVHSETMSMRESIKMFEHCECKAKFKYMTPQISTSLNSPHGVLLILRLKEYKTEWRPPASLGSIDWHC